MVDQKYLSSAYKYLSKNSEKSGYEEKTSAYIAKELEQLGFEVIKCKGSYGVIGVLNGKKSGVAVGARFSLDSLNESGRKYFGYAECAIGLAVAKAFAESKPESGKLVLVFEPKTLSLKGSKAVKNQLKGMEVKTLFGVEVNPVSEMKTGFAAAEIYNAVLNTITVNFKGFTAHGARPHLGINAADAAALSVNSINMIKMKPFTYFDVQTLAIDAGKKSINMIPDKIYMLLEARALEEDTLGVLTDKIKFAVNKCAASIKAAADIEVESCGIPASCYNERAAVYALEDSIIETLGRGALLPAVKSAAQNDFHLLRKDIKASAAYLSLGANVRNGLPDAKAVASGGEILFKALNKVFGKECE